MDLKSKQRLDYQARINRVMDHIGAHLDEDLRLEDLSRVACFSPFHFHRIFAAMTGETLGGHIRRRRLEAAAIVLRDRPDRPVTEVAMDCGFQSPAAFARAFREKYGMSASRWRDGGFRSWRNSGKEGRKNGKAGGKPSKASAPLSGYNCRVNRNANRKRRRNMDVQIKQLPGWRVAYMRHIGPYGPGVSKHWETFRKWRRARELTGPGSAALGISHDDPSITPPERCRYDACVTVPPDFKAEAGVNLADIPGGKYAVLRFRGTDRQIGEAWNSIYRDWLPESGFQCDDRPCFELYTEEHQCHPDGTWECDICVPVRPL